MLKSPSQFEVALGRVYSVVVCGNSHGIIGLKKNPASAQRRPNTFLAMERGYSDSE
jgi:hypothetical protein